MSKITDKPDYDIIEVIGRDIPLVKKGAEYWGKAFCHEDSEPSLRVNEKCYYCDPCGKGGGIYKYLKEKHGLTGKAADKWLSDNFPSSADTKKAKLVIIDTDDYTDADGKLLFQTVRYEPKGFSQRRPNGKGGWIGNLTGVELVPFNLPDVVKADTVFWVEGGKAAKSINALGLTATCTPMGGGNYHKGKYRQHFEGKHLVLLPDNDGPGRKYVMAVATDTLPVAASVKVLELEGLPHKGDVYDWIQARRVDAWTDDQIKAELLRLAEEAPDAAGWMAAQKEAPEINAEAVEGDLPFCFWTKNRNGEIAILQSRLIETLQVRGFFHLRQGDGQYLLVRTRDNVISIVSDIELGHFVQVELLRDLPDKLPDDISKSDLCEKIRRGVGAYLSSMKLSALPLCDLDLMQDTRDAAFYFFRNKYVQVTAKGVELRDYTDLPLPIWESQKIPRDIALITDDDAFKKSNFIKFTERICTHKSEDGDKFDERRYLSLMTVLGDLIHGFVDDTNRHAIILTDGCLDTDPQGGSGKGLLVKAAGFLRKVTAIDGKNLSMKDKFAFSSISLDTKIVHLNDVKRNFNLEAIFTFITDNWVFEQKHVNRVSFKPENSPKTVICTNYAIKGDGASHDRRKFEFELLPYYRGKLFTPKMDLGEEFFKSTWDDNQWCVFCNFMFRCAQMFLRNGREILPYESETLPKKKLIFKTGAAFIEYADGLQRDAWLPAADAYEAFLRQLSDRERRDYNPTKFGLDLRDYCKVYGLTFEKDNKRLKERDNKVMVCYIINTQK